MRTAPILAPAALVMALAAAAPAQPAPAAGTGPATRAVLIDRSLKATPGSIVSLKTAAPAELVFIDDAGKRSTVDLSTILAVAPASFAPSQDSLADDPADADDAVLELTDGQRLVGTLIDPPPAAAGKDRPAAIRHNRLGVVLTPLDTVSRYTAPTAARPAKLSTSTDTVIIGTGDRFEGLVDVLAPTVVLSPAPQKGAAAAPKPEPITAPGLVFAQLANPAVAPKGPRVWLADGTIIAASAVTLERSTVTLVTASSPEGTQLLAGEFRGFAPDASRLTALSTLTPSAVRIDASRPFGDPPLASPHPAPLGASDVLLPGPMTVEWPLPARSTGLLGYAQLDEGCQAWGDCGFTVELVPESGAPRQITQGRLNAASTTLDVRATFDTAAPGTRLRVRVTPGERGPIQDRVLLRRMLVVR